MNQPSTSHPARQVTNPFEINRRVLASDLSLAAKAVLLVILDHARHGQSVCTASTSTIAREAKITERHVRRVLPDLAGRRLIVIERATGSSQSRHTIIVGACIHQVGRPIPLRLHEVGHQVQEVGHSAHGAGGAHPYSSKEKDSEKDAFPLDGKEEIDPETTRWFGHLLAPNA